MHPSPTLPRLPALLCAAGIAAALNLGCQARGAGTPDVVIVGSDYAFQVPDKLPAGTTRLKFDNRCRVPHEMALGLLDAGVTADSILAYAAAGHDPGELAQVVGILIARPGTTAIGTLTTDLLPGRTYLMICSFRDADSLPPHIAMGMQASFVVR